jgi:hypothetical protein
MTPKTLDNFKIVGVKAPGALVDNAALTTTEVDTLGWEFARFVLYLGATDAALTALHVTEADVSATNHVEIPATDFTDATKTDIEGDALAEPTASDGNKFVVIDLDLRGRKRYLDLVATVGAGVANGAYASAWCELYRGDTAPRTNAGRGVLQMVSV